MAAATMDRSVTGLSTMHPIEDFEKAGEIRPGKRSCILLAQEFGAKQIQAGNVLASLKGEGLKGVEETFQLAQQYNMKVHFGPLEPDTKPEEVLATLSDDLLQRGARETAQVIKPYRKYLSRVHILNEMDIRLETIAKNQGVEAAKAATATFARVIKNWAIGFKKEIPDVDIFSGPVAHP